MKKQDKCIVSTSKMLSWHFPAAVSIRAMLMILCQGMMEDVLPKRPRSRQHILTPTRSLGYDSVTFAINRSKFLIHGT